MTPTSASYLPGTPGGQPMTPGNVGMDMMSPLIGLFVLFFVCLNSLLLLIVYNSSNECTLLLV